MSDIDHLYLKYWTNIQTMQNNLPMNIGINKFSFIAFLFLFFAMNDLFGQEITVRGKVSSSIDGFPLYGVNIQVKGSEYGTSTDKEGNYELTIEVSSYADFFYYRGNITPILVFSYTGFRTLEVPVNARKEIDIVLQPEATELGEVVITGTALGKSTKLMSYAIGKLNNDVLEAVPSNNFGVGLQGKVSGLRVNQTGGQPGQGVFFQIRSANSIANGQQPLIIVDGIFLNGTTLADLNPDDIDRIEILKGSAGASLYGSQAANGVIQIFTKRGKGLNIGETKITYRGEIGLAEPTKLYDINKFTNREILNPNGPQPVLGNPSPDNIHNTPLPNFQDYQNEFLFQQGLYHSNYLSISSHDKKTSFFASGQRLDEDGIIQNISGYERNNFRLNIDHQIGNKFDVQISSMFTNSNSNLLPLTSNGPNNYLSTTLFMTPIFDLTAANEEDGSPYDWDIDNTGLSTTNPLYDQSNIEQDILRNRLMTAFKANYYLKDWLVLNYSMSLDHSVNDYKLFLKKGYLSNNLPGLFGAQATFSQQSNGGGIHRSNRIANYFTSRANIRIQQSAGDFNTGLRLSYLYEKFDATFNEGRGENLAVTDIRSLDNAQSNIFISSERQDVIAHSGFAIGDFDYKGKYILSGLFRMEASSLFGTSERLANYYRASAAYRLTEDLKIKGIQELKLRGSIGTAGIRPTFEQRFETFDLINGSATKNTIGNINLRPALSTEIEVGLNMTFLRAFDLEANYAQINTTDQILLVPLTAASGFRGQWQNAGTVDATVYEGTLNIDFAKLFRFEEKGWKWDLTTTFDRIEQTVSELNVPAYTTGPGLQQSSLFLIEEGQPLGTMYGEVFATAAEQLAGTGIENPEEYVLNAAGYLVHQDLIGTPNEVPVKLVDDLGNPILQPLGNINPDFRIGFSNLLQFGGFSLYTLVDWKKGGSIYNMTKHWLFRDQRHAEVSTYPNIAASFFGSEGLYNVLVPNNHFVEDGSYVMIREASIGYTFRATQLQSLFGDTVDQIKLTLQGRNLWTLTDYSGFHPDVTTPPRGENTLTNRFQNALGSDLRTPNGDPSLFLVDAFSYPLTRSYSFSLQVTF